MGLLALGCSADSDRDPAPPISTGITAAQDTESGDDGPGDDGEKLDTPDGDTDDGPAGGDEAGAGGCKKVDLLFVIDNSGSMEDEQANLIASFPAFIDGIRNQLADTEGYHVGVTTSDLYLGGGGVVLGRRALSSRARSGWARATSSATRTCPGRPT